MADLPRLCIFGDSPYACLKQAGAQGLVDVSGAELEYRGHVGGRFRPLEVRDGAIHPTDDFTAMRFAKFNAKGRAFLPAAEDDVTLLRRPEERVAQGMFSALAYAVDGHREKQDFEHHNAAFGAAVLSRVMPIVHAAMRPGAGGGLVAAPGPRQNGREREA